MEITLNGEKRSFDAPLTLAALLESLDLGDKMVLVEQNLKVIPRDELDSVTLSHGDTIEIFRLAGGG
jgi:thiamine biosynthesis protein ThiS